MAKKFKQENMKSFNKKVFDKADFVYETKNNICACTVKTGKNGLFVADKKRYFNKTVDLQKNLKANYGNPADDGIRKWYK